MFLTSPTPTPTVTPLPSATPTPDLAGLLTRISIKRVIADQLSVPTTGTHAGDGSGRLFIGEKTGMIRIYENDRLLDDPFLDITELVYAESSEQGLLGLAFHPDYEENGFFYVHYTDQEQNTAIVRYQVSDNPYHAAPESARIILTVEQPSQYHNGGQLAFGLDGYLYIGLGDGSGEHDEFDNAQNINTLLGAILRIDVNSNDRYDIPSDNPFVGESGVQPEIWDYGLRNPWRFSFDRMTGDLYIGDVGQKEWEEVNIHRARRAGGLNFGWPYREGDHCYSESDTCEPAGVIDPAMEYPHVKRGCSAVVGGYVYRGLAYPDLWGIYLTADYCTGILYGYYRGTDGQARFIELLNTSLIITSFVEDENGELYLLSLRGGGSMYHIMVASQ